MPPLSLDPFTILYLLRHGRTVANSTGLFRGNKDFPLSPDGIRDAHHAKTLMEDLPFSFIVSSDRVRATKTAQIMQGARTTPHETTETLRALNIGEFSGQPRSPENEAKLQTYLDKPSEIIPGGESLNAFRARIRPAIWEAFEIADDSGLPGLLVVHSSIVHELGAMLYGNHKSILVEPGGIVAMYIKNGTIGAEPVYKPMKPQPDASQSGTIS